jgi:hypothetical protein
MLGALDLEVDVAFQPIREEAQADFEGNQFPRKGKQGAFARR